MTLLYIQWFQINCQSNWNIPAYPLWFGSKLPYPYEIYFVLSFSIIWGYCCYVLQASSVLVRHGEQVEHWTLLQQTLHNTDMPFFSNFGSKKKSKSSLSLAGHRRDHEQQRAGHSPESEYLKHLPTSSQEAASALTEAPAVKISRRSSPSWRGSTPTWRIGTRLWTRRTICSR